MEFSELNLHPDIMRGVDAAGYVTCMAVQEQVFVHSFAGEDIYAQSQTGTGKTAAFLISIFQRMMTDPEVRNRKTLIITPTRELAVQIEDEAQRLGKYLDIKMGAFYGGVSYVPQLDMLRDNVQMIIGTPGRIIDLLQQGKMKLNEVGFLVVDEADRMFDMGFIDDIRKLMRYLPPASMRQTFLFSATLGMRIKDLAWEWMRKPKEITIEPEHVTVDLVTQELYHVGSHEKFRLLLGILDREKPRSAIIFCNQKFMVEEIAHRLQVNGIECEFIMGDLPQSKRQSIIDRLKAGELNILVATDVASRGLDVEALDLVLNYDVPEEAESYVHRIGRTARAGKAGKAVTFACEKFVFNLPAVEKFIGGKIPVAAFDTALLLDDHSTRINYRRGQEHDRSRSRDGGQARSRTVRHEAPRRESSREGSYEQRVPYREADSRRPEDQVRPVPVRPTSDRPAAVRPTPDRPDVRSGADPYAISADERMKRYRQKYASDGADTGGGRPQQKAGVPREAAARDERRPGNGPTPSPASPTRATSPAKAQSAARPSSTFGNTPAKRPVGPAKSTGTTRSAPQQEAAKPGFLARLKGLFGRSKD